MKETNQRTEDLKKLRNRINWFCENRVNAFSPTISPAPKSIEHKEIESIGEGIRFYTERGVTELLIQKKFMGSYCDIYLHKNIAETYFVSRNGHRIEHIDLDEARRACEELHKQFDWSNLSLVIIQSELMPWHILGKGLIDNEFEGYLDAHKHHLNFLKSSTLYHKISRIKSSEPFMAFISDRSNMEDKAFRGKYPSHVIRQYSSLEQFEIQDLQMYEEGIRVFDEQISHFGQETAIHFKPFNILKKIYDDGSEVIPDDNLTYNEVNNEPMLHFHIENNEQMEEAVKITREWFESLTKEKEEGIIIKPRKAFIPGMPPALKVRNNYYLTMIYGINFIRDLDYNIRKRSIARKIECSTNDWAINKKLISIPYRELHKENYHLKNLVYDRIMGERSTSMLDTRL